MFYVPKRNQHLIRSSLPTSHGFKPLPREGAEEIFNPLLVASSNKNRFEMLFDFVGTLDNSPYICIKEALAFRREVCGGDEKIMNYCQNLSLEAAKMCAQTLGTELMENKEETLTKCFMVNVRLPLTIGSKEGEIAEKSTYAVAVWITSRISDEYDMYSPVFIHAGKFWTRWSAQIYLDIEDFVKGAEALRAMCERVKKGEYLK